MFCQAELIGLLKHHEPLYKFSTNCSGTGPAEGPRRPTDLCSRGGTTLLILSAPLQERHSYSISTLTKATAAFLIAFPLLMKPERHFNYY